jgi:hypothetical protein
MQKRCSLKRTELQSTIFVKSSVSVCLFPSVCLSLCVMSVCRICLSSREKERRKKRKKKKKIKLYPNQPERRTDDHEPRLTTTNDDDHGERRRRTNNDHDYWNRTRIDSSSMRGGSETHKNLPPARAKSYKTKRRLGIRKSSDFEDSTR